jgi:hypothetical protein
LQKEFKMPIQNINTLKSWFARGLKPLQNQFYDLIDSFRHKNEKIAYTDLAADLQDAINVTGRVILAAPGTVDAWTFQPGTLIEKVYVQDNATITFSLGTTPGGTDIIDNIEIDPVDSNNGIFEKCYYCKTTTTLYWSGINEDTIIKIYKS